MPAAIAESAQAEWPFQLSYDAWGRLIFTDPSGERHERVTIVRAFPITNPEGMVSILSPLGHELAWVESIDELPAALREIVLKEFGRREFLPQILRIVSVSGRIEPCEWVVETDRGSHRFVLAAHEDVHRLGGHRALVIDSEKIRYLIPDVRRLDAASRRYLEKYL